MLRAFIVGCACVIAASRPAAAEWHITPMIGATFAGNTSLIDLENATGRVHPQIGGAVSLLGSGVLGVEAIGVLTPGFFQTGSKTLLKNSRTLAFMGNAVLTLPQRWTEYSLRPFVSGGLGLIHVTAIDTIGVLPVDSNVAGFDIGGGAIGFLTANTGVRFDLRYYANLHHPGQEAPSIGPPHLRYMTASIGIVFRR